MSFLDKLSLPSAVRGAATGSMWHQYAERELIDKTGSLQSTSLRLPLPFLKQFRVLVTTGTNRNRLLAET